MGGGWERGSEHMLGGDSGKGVGGDKRGEDKTEMGERRKTKNCDVYLQKERKINKKRSGRVGTHERDNERTHR